MDQLVILVHRLVGYESHPLLRATFIPLSWINQEKIAAFRRTLSESDSQTTLPTEDRTACQLNRHQEGNLLGCGRSGGHAGSICPTSGRSSARSGSFPERSHTLQRRVYMHPLPRIVAKRSSRKLVLLPGCVAPGRALTSSSSSRIALSSSFEGGPGALLGAREPPSSSCLR